MIDYVDDTSVVLDRIVGFDLSKDKKTIEIGERCDAWFHTHMNKAEFAEFIAELQTLHGRMVT